ncbi:mitochondrial thiamine pyrophosphate transporter [Ranunculus cassubicifolius]
MEDPLISRGGSSNNHSSSSRRREKKQHNTRSDAIAHGDPYEKAAALVDLAEDGIGLPEELLNDPRFEHSAKFYFMYIRVDFLWTINLFALVALNFFEKPLWCDRFVTHSCSDREYFFLGQLPYLSKTEALIYEGITLIILIIHTFFPITYEGWQRFWGSLLNKLKIICLFILIADLLVYALYLSPVGIYNLPVRIAPYVRIVFFTFNLRELRACAVTICGMLGMYANVLALGLLFLLFSSWLAYIIFEDTQQGNIMFYSYGVTLYQMFVLFTTSNNPDVWIPAYKESRWYSLFFVIYVLLGVYFLTNLILAVVYDSFKEQLVKQVSEMDTMRKGILGKAFNLIDNQQRGFLDKEQCIRLFEELNKYRSLPKTSREDFELLFDELDSTDDFKICLEEFNDLCSAIALRFEKEVSPSMFEYYPSFYHARSIENFKDFVTGPKFGYIVAAMLMLNLVAVVIETTLDIEDSTGQSFWQVLEFVFGWIYVVEMALKIFATGFGKYWLEGQNRFDFVITWIIVIGETATFISPFGLTFLQNGEWIRYLLIARLLRLIRLLMHVQRYRAFLATFLTLIPSLMPYLGSIFCVLCIYCSLGVQIFGGLVNAGNPDLKGSTLDDNDYLLFNLNDYPNGMITLFNLVVLGNWQAWMEGYKELTGTSWTLVYFISFYLLTILLLLNLVVAFVLEAFFAEIELEEKSGGHAQDPSKQVQGGGGRTRYVRTKTRSGRVDALLHHMLSDELQDECSTHGSSEPAAPQQEGAATRSVGFSV